MNLKCPTSWKANWKIRSLVKGSSLAFLPPIGGSPPSVRFGATLSKPRPKEAHKNNSASKYSKFRGNSKRSTSESGIAELCLVNKWSEQRAAGIESRKRSEKTTAGPAVAVEIGNAI